MRSLSVSRALWVASAAYPETTHGTRAGLSGRCPGGRGADPKGNVPLTPRSPIFGPWTPCLGKQRHLRTRSLPELGNATPNSLMPHAWGLKGQADPSPPHKAGQEAKDNGPRQSFHPEISKRHLINPAQVGDFLWSPFGEVWSGTSSSQISAWIGAPGIPDILCSLYLGSGV